MILLGRRGGQRQVFPSSPGCNGLAQVGRTGGAGNKAGPKGGSDKRRSITLRRKEGGMTRFVEELRVGLAKKGEGVAAGGTLGGVLQVVYAGQTGFLKEGGEVRAKSGKAKNPG